MRNDVGVLTTSIFLREVEPQSEAARISIIFIVGNLGQAGRVRETDSHWC